VSCNLSVLQCEGDARAAQAAKEELEKEVAQLSTEYGTDHYWLTCSRTIMLKWSVCTAAAKVKDLVEDVMRAKREAERQAEGAADKLQKIDLRRQKSQSYAVRKETSAGPLRPGL
jgi:hypothetical protein